jgi:hypothetical protein
MAWIASSVGYSLHDLAYLATVATSQNCAGVKVRRIRNEGLVPALPHLHVLDVVDHYHEVTRLIVHKTMTRLFDNGRILAIINSRKFIVCADTNGEDPASFIKSRCSD